MHLLEANGRRVLFDCRPLPGKRKRSLPANREIDLDGLNLDAVLLSHRAHRPQRNLRASCGAAQGHDLRDERDLRPLLHHAARLGAHPGTRWSSSSNKKRIRDGKTPSSRSIPPTRRERRSPTSSRFLRAALPSRRRRRGDLPRGGPHPRAAMIEVRVKEAWAGTARSSTAATSAGPGSRSCATRARGPADTLVMESTYGGRTHERMGAPAGEAALRHRPGDRAGGKVVITAFSVGRTQTLVFTLHKLWTRASCLRSRSSSTPRSPSMRPRSSGGIPSATTRDARVPVAGCRSLRPLAPDLHPRPRGFQAAARPPRPCAIISASGMCEPGASSTTSPRRSRPAKHDPDHRLPGREHPGRHLVERQERIKIFGEEAPPQGEVVTVNALSPTPTRGSSSPGSPRARSARQGLPRPRRGGEREGACRALASAGSATAPSRAGERRDL